MPLHPAELHVAVLQVFRLQSTVRMPTLGEKQLCLLMPQVRAWPRTSARAPGLRALTCRARASWVRREGRPNQSRLVVALMGLGLLAVPAPSGCSSNISSCPGEPSPACMTARARPQRAAHLGDGVEGLLLPPPLMPLRHDPLLFTLRQQHHRHSGTTPCRPPPPHQICRGGHRQRFSAR